MELSAIVLIFCPLYIGVDWQQVQKDYEKVKALAWSVWHQKDWTNVFLLYLLAQQDYIFLVPDDYAYLLRHFLDQRADTHGGVV